MERVRLVGSRIILAEKDMDAIKRVANEKREPTTLLIRAALERILKK